MTTQSQAQASIFQCNSRTSVRKVRPVIRLEKSARERLPASESAGRVDAFGRVRSDQRIVGRLGEDELDRSRLVAKWSKDERVVRASIGGWIRRVKTSPGS